MTGKGSSRLGRCARGVSRPGMAVALALACGSLTVCAPAPPTDRVESDRRAGAAPTVRGTSEDEICLRGAFTEEGVECRAVRAADGALYTLSGDLSGAPGSGSTACVCGRVAELSTCMQGTTIAVSRIGPPDACP